LCAASSASHRSHGRFFTALLGGDLEGLPDKFRKRFLLTWLRSLQVWPIYDTVLYAYVPPSHRPLFNTFMSLLWGGYLSAISQSEGDLQSLAAAAVPAPLHAHAHADGGQAQAAAQPPADTPDAGAAPPLREAEAEAEPASPPEPKHAAVEDGGPEVPGAEDHEDEGGAGLEGDDGSGETAVESGDEDYEVEGDSYYDAENDDEGDFESEGEEL
jgi:hypothetical protein